jgi:DNA-binding CsgD family transcriptional regulator
VYPVRRRHALEVFEHIGAGLTTVQVAERMHISRMTVETYRARIKEKLEVTSMTEVVQRAARWVLKRVPPQADS